VPSINRELNKMDETQVRAMVKATISLYPILHEIYDAAFIEKLVRRRSILSNFLISALTQPGDEISVHFWTSTVNDLICLLDEGALERFRDDLRKEDRHDLQVARSELAIAAWMKRRGFSIILEPLTNGSRRCEFRAGTVPPTWWEIKTPHDVTKAKGYDEAGKELVDNASVRRDKEISSEIHRALDGIPQPYVLDYDFGAAFARAHVASALKEIKRQIAAHHANGGSPGISFEHLGLRVDIVDTTNKPHGYIGVTLGREYVFEREYMEMIQKLTDEAARQLPAREAGVVVIDATMTDFMDLDDMKDACYGELGGIERLPDGVFRRDDATRVSAVVLYEHNVGHWGRDYRFTAFHNPFAAKPLPEELFATPDAQQFRLEAVGNGMFRLADLNAK
jgi:hypothetical protein